MEHWLLLASTLHVLMQPNISRDMLNAADTMLSTFVLLQHSFLKGTADIYKNCSMELIQLLFGLLGHSC